MDKKLNDISEEKKLIDEFMELVIITKKASHNRDQFITIIDEEGNCFNSFEELKYDSSWKSLMAVLDKIEGLNYTSEIYFLAGLGHKTTFFSGGVEVFNSRTYSSKKESVYKSVVKFIQWYNERKEEHE